MALSIITDKFRVESAKKFVQAVKARNYPNDFSTTQTDYGRTQSEVLEGNIDSLYMFIGKITPWYANGDEEPVPAVAGDMRQESEVWSNALAAKRITTDNISHVTVRDDWQVNTIYPSYRSNASNTSTFSNSAEPNFFVLDPNEYRVYKCLWNNYGATTEQRPTNVGGVGGDPQRVQVEPFYTSDGYLWKYMYTIDPALAISFLTDDYIPVRKDIVNDNGTDQDNSGVDGAIYKIIFPEKSTETQVVQAPSGSNKFVRVRIDDIVTATDVTVVGDVTTLTIDISGVNGDRIATATDDDLIGYQIEHVIDDGTSKSIEIGEIIDSTFNTQSVDVIIKRLDDVDATGFTDATTAGNTETWFMSPLVDIRGEGENASAMLYLDGENGFDETNRRLYPTEVDTQSNALDVIMNTYGQGYRNIYERNDTDGTLNSLVSIKMGSALLGASTGTTDVSDREITDTAEILSVTPRGGHSYDNVAELYAFSIMITNTFDGSESGFATVLNDFRQISLIQNPVEQDGTLADATVYRQSVRLEFDGNVTTSVSADDEISDQQGTGEEKTTFGYVVSTEYDSGADKTRVLLSSTNGFFQKTAQEVLDIGTLYVSHDASAGTSPYTALTLSSRLTTVGSDGEYQKGLSNNADTGLQFMTGELLYTENRKPIIRAADQSENVKLVIEY